ncbi:MAG TPA: type II secretion system protein N [Usitatibacter sp.]|nr:type II secretion system protein N [Usitatibacter sp.]
MRRLAFAALFVAAYLVFMVALLPASFVASRLPQWTQGAVQLLRPEGTVWNGSGALTLATVAGPLAIDHVRWRLLPARFFLGRMEFDVTATAGAARADGRVARNWSSWKVSGNALADAAGAAQLFPLLSTWRPEGRLALDVARASWNGSELRGSAGLAWDDAAVAFSDVRPLGSYRVELRGTGGPARFTLLTTKGPLQLTGHGTVTPQGRVEFAGNARAEGTHAASLEPVLKLLGPRRPDGAHGLSWPPGAR